MVVVQEARKYIQGSVERQDKHFKATLFPKQFFVGGFEITLRDKKVLDIYFNAKGKLNFRFSIEASPKNGFQSKDISVTFNQLEMISTKEGKNEVPAAVSAHLTDKAAKSLLSELGDVKNLIMKLHVDKSEQSSDPHKQLIFVLSENPEEKNKEDDVYMKVAVSVGDSMKYFEFDMEDAIDILNKDIKKLWHLCLTPHWRALYGMNRTSNLIEPMNDRDWKLYLKHNNLHLKMLDNGDWRYYNFFSNSNVTSHIMDLHSKKPQRGEILLNDGVRGMSDQSLGEGEAYSYGSQIDVDNNKSKEYTLKCLDSRHVIIRAKNWFFRKRQMDSFCEMKSLGIYDNTVVKGINKEFLLKLSGMFSCTDRGDTGTEIEERIMKTVEESNRIFTEKPKFDGNGENQGDPYEYNQFVDYNDLNVMEYFFMSRDSTHETVAKKPKFDFGTKKRLVVSLDVDICEEANQKENLIKDERCADDLGLVRPDDELLTFPPSNVKNEDFDGVIVCYKDLRVLDRMEFMNDSIVNFMIGYINCYMLSLEMKKRVHFFNTFFYSALSRQMNPIALARSFGRRSVQIDTLKTNVSRVVKWTKKKDLFEKEFVVIPINEDLHWLLVIIVNPSGAIVDMENEEESRKKDPTYIMFFDPLSGLDSHRRLHMTFYFKAYLEGLFDKTKCPGGKFEIKTPSIFDAERIKVIIPKNTATQKNFLDCGSYVLHYIENFFSSLKPITIKDCENLDWEEMFPRCNEMADLMRDKIFNIINKLCKPQVRSRLAKFEMQYRKGLTLEGDRRHRRHSAVYPRQSKRHTEYHARHYSIRPHFPLVIDDEFFKNPRQTSSMLITKKVRKLEPPYGEFTRFY